MVWRFVKAWHGVGQRLNDAAIQVLSTCGGHSQKFHPVAVPRYPANSGGLNAERLTLWRHLQTEFDVKTEGHGPLVFDGAAMNGEVEETPNGRRGSCHKITG